MKVLLFNGSTRTNGCTYLALSEISKTLEQEGIDTEILPVGRTAGMGLHRLQCLSEHRALCL